MSTLLMVKMAGNCSGDELLPQGSTFDDLINSPKPLCTFCGMWNPFNNIMKMMKKWQKNDCFNDFI